MLNDAKVVRRNEIKNTKIKIVAYARLFEVTKSHNLNEAVSTSL